MVSRLTIRFGTYLVAGLSAWAVSYGYSVSTAPEKIETALVNQMGNSERVNVVIVLGFKPEQTHLRIFQNYGTVAGIRDDRVVLVRVPSEYVERIARYYWVDAILAANGASG